MGVFGFECLILFHGVDVCGGSVQRAYVERRPKMSNEMMYINE